MQTDPRPAPTLSERELLELVLAKLHKIEAVIERAKQHPAIRLWLRGL